MKEFLEMCGFESREMDAEIPRIKKAFDKLRITDVDIDVAKDRLMKYYQMDLMGFRKVLKIYIKELTNLILAREEKQKIIYNTLPALLPFLTSSATIAGKGTVYAGHPDVLLLAVYGGIFDKMTPVLEASENDVLIMEGAHCGCNKAKLGARVLDLTPKADLLLSWVIYCDEAPKVDNYLNTRYGVPIVSISRIQDANFGEDFTQREIDYFGQEIRKAKEVIGEVIGADLTDEILWQSLMEAGMTMQFVEKILSLQVNSDPVPLSITTVYYFFLLYVAGVSRENMPLLEEAMDLLLEETQTKIDRGEGYYEQGAPRVAIYVPSLADPSLVHLVKEVGLAIPLMEGVWFCPDAALAPDLGISEEMDPCKIMARPISRTPITAPTHQRISAMAQAANRHNLEGFLGLNHYSCRPLMNDGFILKDAWKKNMKVPVAQIEADVYDNRFYTSEALRTRIESFAEMCKMNKAAKMRAMA